MIAAHKGYATTVELLLAAGADVATKSSCVPGGFRQGRDVCWAVQ